MSRPNHLSRSFSPFDQQRTLVVEIEMSQSSWLVSGIVPGVDRQPLKKLDPDENALLRLLQRWRGEAGDWARRSSAPLSPSSPAGRAFGSRGGSGHGASRRTSCIRRASQSLGSTVEPSPTGSIPSLLKRAFLEQVELIAQAPFLPLSVPDQLPVPQQLDEPQTLRLPPVEDRLHDVRRQASQRQEPADIGVRDAFLLRKVGDRLGLPALDPAPPPARAHERLINVSSRRCFDVGTAAPCGVMISFRPPRRCSRIGMRMVRVSSSRAARPVITLQPPARVRTRTWRAPPGSPTPRRGSESRRHAGSRRCRRARRRSARSAAAGSAPALPGRARPSLARVVDAKDEAEGQAQHVEK